MNHRGRFYNSPKSYRKFFFYFSLVFLISLFIIGFFMLKPTLQGKAILNLEGDYQNNSFNGNVLLDLKNGELIPSDSILTIENNGESYEYPLSQFFKESPKEGTYYLENKGLNGSGLGYGFYGVKKEYPEVYFNFYVVKENQSEVFGGSSSEEIVVPENPVVEEQVNSSENIVQEISSNETSSTETTPEFAPEIISEESAPPSSSNSETSSSESSKSVSQSEAINEPTSESSPGIINAFLGFIQRAFLGLSPTGKVSSESGNEVQGSVKYGNEFKYKLNPNENIKIVSGSVKTDFKELSEDVLIIKIENNELTISTSYAEETPGFGKDYLGENQNRLILDIFSLNLPLSEGDLKISINYGREEISSFETVLKENETILVNEINITPKENETIVMNETNITENKTEIILNKFNLTSDELNILYKEFGNVSIKSSSKLFKDRVIVTFSLNSYESKYSYDSNLSDVVIQRLIEKDKANWLKDMANRLSTEKSISQSLNKFNESFSLNQSI